MLQAAAQGQLFHNDDTHMRVQSTFLFLHQGLAMLSCSVYIRHYMAFIRKIKKGDRIYLAEVENRRIGGKVVQRFIRYVGKQADGRTVLSTSMSDVEVESVKLYGPLLVLHHLATEIQLADMLRTYSQEILSLVYAHCLDYRSLNSMPSWFERTDLNFLLRLEGLTEKRLVSALDSLEALDAEAWQQQLFEGVCRQYHLRPAGVIYDVTNTYLYGRHCSLAKPGKDKEEVKGRPLIQVGLGVTQDEGIPLFHKVFDGNVHDTHTLQDLITLFGRYQLGPGLFIYDRGIVSGRNLKDIKRLRWDTLCGVPLNPALKKFWRPWADPKQLMQLPNRHRVGQTVFYTCLRPYQLDGVSGNLALCFNERLQRDMRESRRDEILYAQKLLAQDKSIKPGMERFFDARGRLIPAKLAQIEEFDGYSCIFCTRALPPDKMLCLYFDKDIVEKAFHSLKGITQLRPVRHWLAERAHAHVFICYLAYLLLSLLKYRLRHTEFTAESALLGLATMYKVYLRDSKHRFKLSRVVALTKRQEAILESLDRKLLSLEN
jgi:transposase